MEYYVQVLQVGLHLTHIFVELKYPGGHKSKQDLSTLYFTFPVTQVIHNTLDSQVAQPPRHALHF